MPVAVLSWSCTLAAAPSAEAWTFWDERSTQNNILVDHSSWQALLDKRVETLADGRTIVHYDAFSDNDRTRLRDYLAATSRIDPRQLTGDEQFAYWINLYNALTVDLMLQNPGKASILRIGGGFLRTGPWDDEVVTIAGEALTLNDIEHRILRPLFNDHRIHFAVNCASIGCPNLAATAFTAANLEQLLAAGEQTYLQHPRGLSYADGKLTASSIFKWYQDDFAADRAGLLVYFAKHRPDLAEALRGYTGKLRFSYDWDRNDQ